MAGVKRHDRAASAVDPLVRWTQADLTSAHRLRSRATALLIHWLLPLLAYAGIAAGFALGAVALLPSDKTPTLLGTVSLDVHHPAGAEAPLVTVGQSINADYEPGPRGQELHKRFTATYIEIGETFSKATIGTVVSYTVSYPDAAEFDHCARRRDDIAFDPFGSPVISCSDSAKSASAARDPLSAAATFPTVTVKTRIAKDTDAPHEPFTHVRLVFKGAPGLFLAYGGGHFVGELPRVSGQSKGARTLVGSLLQTSERFQWTSGPPDQYSAKNAEIAWLESYNESSSSEPATVSGVDQGRLDRDDRRTLLAGAALGLAGAAFIAFVQHLAREL